MNSNRAAWYVEIPGAGLPYPTAVMLADSEVSAFRDMIAEASGVREAELTRETYATGGFTRPVNPVR